MDFHRRSDIMTQIALTKGYVPGLIGRITELHGVYYHQHWRFGRFFEEKVATELAAFMNRYDHRRDAVWTAASRSGRMPSFLQVFFKLVKVSRCGDHPDFWWNRLFCAFSHTPLCRFHSDYCGEECSGNQEQATIRSCSCADAQALCSDWQNRSFPERFHRIGP